MDHGPPRVICGLQLSKSKRTSLNLMMVSFTLLSLTREKNSNSWPLLTPDHGKYNLSKEIETLSRILNSNMNGLLSQTQSGKMSWLNVTNTPKDFGQTPRVIPARTSTTGLNNIKLSSILKVNTTTEPK